ncbi:MAG TPA: hypothetical protein DD379_07510 [Cyanobacteria bacterium UBA11162]|nr:hypothetical protein [Cyanobacteria bacterium UBA11162]
MGTQVNFILKVLILSMGISVLIRYRGSSLPVTPTSVNVLIAILAPSFILAIALLWRAWNYPQKD